MDDLEANRVVFAYYYAKHWLRNFWFELKFRRKLREVRQRTARLIRLIEEDERRRANE